MAAATPIRKSTPDAPGLTALPGYAGTQRLAELNQGVIRELGDNLTGMYGALLRAREPSDMLGAYLAATQMLAAIGSTYCTRLFVLANENLPEFVKVFEQRMMDHVPTFTPLSPTATTSGT